MRAGRAGGAGHGGAVREGAGQHRGARRRGAAVAGWFLAGALALSGCTGGDDGAGTSGAPVSSPAVSSTGSPDSSPAAETYQPATSTSPARNVPEPVMPEAAKENSFAGQKAFVQYWFDTYNYAFDTGDTTAMKAVSTDDCETCSRAIASAKSIYADLNTWRVGGTTTLTTEKFVSQGDEAGLVLLDVPATDSAVAFYTKKGANQDLKARGKRTSQLRIWLKPSNGGWLVSEIGHY